MKYLLPFLAGVLSAIFPAFPQVGALTFCSHTSLSSEDSVWAVTQSITNAPREADISPPQILEGYTPQPVYPDSALAAGISGEMIVAAYVSSDGTLLAWQPLRIEPEGWGFEEAVAKVICQWRFVPALSKNEPVHAVVGVPFNFKLDTGK